LLGRSCCGRLGFPAGDSGPENGVCDAGLQDLDGGDEAAHCELLHRTYVWSGCVVSLTPQGYERVVRQSLRRQLFAVRCAAIGELERGSRNVRVARPAVIDLLRFQRCWSENKSDGVHGQVFT
jgi:hypothetical protein